MQNNQPIKIHAGQEPILVAKEYCAKSNINDANCDQIIDHFCTQTKLKCRSKRSLLAEPVKHVGFAHAHWKGMNGNDCAIGTYLLQSDAEKAPVVDRSSFISEDKNPLYSKRQTSSPQKRLQQGENVYLESLVMLHCSNLVRFFSDCYCTQEVVLALTRALFDQLDLYVWSESSSHYAKLAVDPFAEHDELKKSYRAFSFALHPDRSSYGPERIIMLREAYEVLMDNHAREKYDLERFGKAFVSKKHMPDVQAQAFEVFGRHAFVSMDANGNLKIVF